MLDSFQIRRYQCLMIDRNSIKLLRYFDKHILVDISGKFRATVDNYFTCKKIVQKYCYYQSHRCQKYEYSN